MEHKNIWLGKDIAMGRTEWSFRNTDLEPTHFFCKTQKNTGINYHKISDIEKYRIKNMSNYASLKQKIDNYLYVEKDINKVYVGNMKGRGLLQYKGYVENGYSLIIKFDDQIVEYLPSSYYSEWMTLNIPSGTQYVYFSLEGNYPFYFNKASGWTTYPFIANILGVVNY